MRMRRGVDVRPSREDRGMDDESRLIDRPIADQDIALMVDELQIRHPDLAEMPGQRIDPEALGMFGIANRHVAGEALVEAVVAEETERRG